MEKEWVFVRWSIYFSTRVHTRKSNSYVLSGYRWFTGRGSQGRHDNNRFS